MVEIDPSDLRYTPYPERSVGGQHVGVSAGVSVEHVPTGIIVTVATERSQHRNKQIALDGILGAITSPHFRG